MRVCRCFAPILIFGVAFSLRVLSVSTGGPPSRPPILTSESEEFLMAAVAKKREIDLSVMKVDELQTLIAKIERELTTRNFEEGLRKALRDYQGRDPNVIRL